MTAFETVTARLIAVTGHEGRNGKWLCPAHDDRNPSLSVTNGDGLVKINCHADCPTENVVAALGLEMKDLFDQPNTQDRISKTYEYTDEHHKLLFKVHRFWPKDFRQQAADGAWSLKNVRRVIYRLPEVLEAAANNERIFVVEGEKDADAIVANLGVATCNPAGAGKWRDEYSCHLIGADVVIVADKDDVGRQHARRVRGSLVAAGVNVEAVVEARFGKDAADHLAAGCTLDDFQVIDIGTDSLHDLIAGPDSDSSADEQWMPTPIDWEAFWRHDHPDEDWLIEPFLVRGRAHALYAPGKTGKSLIVLEAVVALTTGTTFLYQAPAEPIDVIYLDYEMTEGDLQQRLDNMDHSAATDLSHLHYFLVPTLSALDTPEGGQQILRLVQHYNAQLVVIDTTARAVAGDENEADTYRALYRHTGMLLKHHNITYIRVDHAGKDLTRGQRGSSAKNDDVDIVWKLTGTDEKFSIECTHQRVGYIPARVELKRTQDPLKHVISKVKEWSAGVEPIARQLDRIGVPEQAGRPAARAIINEWNETHSNDQVTCENKLLAEVLRWRKSGLRLPPVVRNV